MTTADEKMREEFEEWYLSEVDMDADFHLVFDTPYYHDSHTQMAWLGWQQCAARQEGYPGIAHDLELMKASAAQYSERIKELERDVEEYKASAMFNDQQNEQLQAQVAMLRDAVEHDAKLYKIPLTAKLCEAISTTTQTAEAYKRRIQAEAWQPIETAPKDTVIDVWVSSSKNPEWGARVPSVHKSNDKWYGLPEHFPDYVYPSRWMPLPPSPELKGE